MVQRLSHTTVYVLNQDEAKKFYTEVLGFDLRMDFKMENGFRWLTVSPKAQPDLEIVLMQVDGPNVKPDVSVVLKGLLEKGHLGGGVLATPDCRKTYEELKEKGVTFVAPPAERFYGVEAILRDNSGNWFSLTEPKAR